MARKIAFLGALPLFLLSLQVGALALGDITLRSGLNQLLDAEIEIQSATPQELNNLTARIASLETFNRYGLDRPDFMSDLRFRVGSNAAGRDVLQVSSTQALREPFLTFLVDASWPGGRLLREYTVLLDPPVFMTGPPEQVAPSPRVAAPPPRQVEPVAAPPPRQIAPAESRPAPAPRFEEAAPAQPAPQPVWPAAAGLAQFGTVYGPVQRNETLWGIATRLRAGSGLTTNQIMLAIFRANPEAFAGNINRLKAGPILRIPDLAEMDVMDRRTAFAEVQRQETEWRTGRAGAAAAVAAPGDEGVGRLRLVAPGEAGAADAGAADAAASARRLELEAQVADLEAELTEARRLLTVRDTDLARLQQALADTEARLAALEVETPEMPVAETPGVDLEPALPKPVEAGGEQLAEMPPSDTGITPPLPGAGTTEPAVGEPVEPPIASEPEPAPETVSPQTAVPRVTPEVVEPEPGAVRRILDGVLSFFQQFWTWIAGAAVLGLIALGGMQWMKRRRAEAEAAESWDELVKEADLSAEAETEISERTGEIIALHPDGAPAEPAAEAVADIEATGTFKPGQIPDITATGETAAGGAAAESEAEYPFEDTMTGTALQLDQSDPLAEADFHMAYGLYDQAAELIKGAAEREPDRQDLRLKLLEIYFVWGNRDAFLDAARELRASLGDAAGGEWDKILIMGKQICPEDPLFAGKAAAVVESGASVDLDLEGAAGTTSEIEVLEAPTEADSGIIDLDLGDALEASAEPAPDETPQPEAAPFVPPAAAGADEAKGTVEFDLDDLGLDLDFGDVSADAGGEKGAVTATSDDLDEIFKDFAALAESEEAGAAEAGAAATYEEELLAAAPDTEINLQIDEDALTAELDAPGTGEEPDTEINLRLDEQVDFPLEQTASAATAAAEDMLDVDLGDIAELEPTLSEPEEEEAGLDLDLAVLGALEETESPVASEDLTEDLGLDLDIGAPAEVDATKIMARQEPAEVEEEPEFDLDLDLDFAAVSDGEEPATEAADEGTLEGVDLDFGELGGDLAEETVEANVQEEAEAVDIDFGDMAAGEPAAHEATQVMRSPVLDEAEETIDLHLADSRGGDIGRAEPRTLEIPAADMALPDDEPATLNEVGTKLDLARAYVDMGDPDGARSILEEVLEEGDDTQREEARELISALA